MNTSTHTNQSYPSTSIQYHHSSINIALTMSSPEKEAPRFKSFPHEVRDKIYRYLLSAASHKCERTRELVTHWGPISQSTYVFDTAILRTNRNVSQEAYNVLYNDNPLVLLDFGTDNNSYLKTFILGNVAFIHVMEGSQLPPCPIRI